MKRIGINDKCIGCGAEVDDPECECEWRTCSCCGYPDCLFMKKVAITIVKLRPFN